MPGSGSEPTPDSSRETGTKGDLLKSEWATLGSQLVVPLWEAVELRKRGLLEEMSRWRRGWWFITTRLLVSESGQVWALSHSHPASSVMIVWVLWNSKPMYLSPHITSLWWTGCSQDSPDITTRERIVNGKHLNRSLSTHQENCIYNVISGFKIGSSRL